MHGKSIELFLANGTADSIVTAELSNWNGKAIKIPRIEVADCNCKNIQEPDVYFLFCKDEDNDTDSVYIGEAENVKERLFSISGTQLQRKKNITGTRRLYLWAEI